MDLSDKSQSNEVNDIANEITALQFSLCRGGAKYADKHAAHKSDEKGGYACHFVVLSISSGGMDSRGGNKLEVLPSVAWTIYNNNEPGVSSGTLKQPCGVRGDQECGVLWIND